MCKHVEKIRRSQGFILNWILNTELSFLSENRFTKSLWKKLMIYKPAQIACQMPIGHAEARKTSKTCSIFRARIFFLVKRKKTLNLQVFSWIGKTIKKLQWIPNTIINTNVLEYFDNVYISDGFITGLSTHELGSI